MLTEAEMDQIARGGEKNPQAICQTCDDNQIVNTPWPSGYPHVFPCPTCKPNTPCECKSPDCPGPVRVEEWKKEMKQ